MSQQPAYIPPSPTKKGMSGGAIAAIIGGAVLLIVVLCGGFVALMLPALGKAREAAQQAMSSAQMKMISMSLQQYALDNADQLPEAGADLPSRLAKYGASANMFTSPSAPAGGPSYIYVPQGKLGDIKNPSQTVVLYENPAIPSTMGWNVAYADGSVILISPERYQPLINSITLPDGTPFVPEK